MNRLYRKIAVVAVQFILLIIVNADVVAQFTLSPGGFVSVKEGGSLYIDTDLNIKSVAGSSGYLVDNTVDGDITITGDITVQRYMTADMWHNVASPVSNEHSNCFPGTELVFYYDETIILNDWNFGWVMYSGPLEVFRGYDVLFFDNPVTVTYQATAAESINTGSYAVGVTHTLVDGGEIPEHRGWNLVANPYPSPVDWLAATGWNKSNINDAKYIWDGTNSVYTIFIGGGAPIGLNGGTQYIPSNQGFWVQATANGNFGINNAVRVGDITGTPDFYKDGEPDYPLISLVSQGNGYSDEVIVRFIQGTTEGFDLNYDAVKFYSMNSEVPQLSILENGTAFALNTYPDIHDDLGIELEFKCSKQGYYSINLDERTSLDAWTEVYLKDNVDGETVNLKNSGSYGFHHDPANRKERFVLWINPNEDLKNNLEQQNYFKVHAYKNVITILKNTVKDISGKICLYNMLGETVFFKPLTNEKISNFQVDMPTGYYIVRIISEQYQSSSKVLIVN